MKFIKENIHDIVRLMLNQVALAVFGLVIVSAARMTNGNEIGVFAFVASILSVLFYMYILYATMQETGSKHRVRVDGGRMKRDCTWGLKIMTLAQIPNLILLLILWIGFFVYLAPASSDAGKSVFAVVQMILYILQAPYDGIIGFISGSAADTKTMLLIGIGYTLSIIPGMLVCWGSYVMGLHDKKISSLFINAGNREKKQ